ncbi:MAG: hypothetical protein ACTS8S_00125 [Giesbergeria sp.]
MTKKAGRPVNEIAVPPAIDPALDQGKLDGAMLAMREQANAQREDEDAQLARAAQAVGGALMARLHKQFAHAAEVNMFLQVRDLPLAVLRRIPLPEIADTSANFGSTSEGEVKKIADTSANLEDFCRRVFGRSATTMREEAQNLNLLGEQAYESAARLGISKGALRVTRTLPPEKLEIVRTAIAAGSTKAEVLSVIEDLAEKVEQAEAATAELQADLKAGEEVLAAKNKTIDRLQRELKRIEKLPPDAQLAGLKKEATVIATEAEAMVLGGLRQALLLLNSHGEERGEHGVFMAGLVRQVQAQLGALCHEFNLPEIGDGKTFEPEAALQIREGLAQLRAKQQQEAA